MKLSKNTLLILKNFSTINPSIYVRQGNVLRTIAISGNIAASATLEDTFDVDFAIYDLNTFLNGLRLYDSPELEFDISNGCVYIVDGTHKIKYVLTNPKLVTHPENRDIRLPTKDVCFEVLQSEFEKLMKASNVFSLPDLSVIGDSEKIVLKITDKNNASSNEASICVGETNQNFELNYKIEDIKIIPGDYEVVISKHLLSEFTNKAYDIKYYIGLGVDSKFHS
jgi:hypothetical protein